MKLERELMRGAGPLAVMGLLRSGEKYGYELIKQLEKQGDGILAMGHSTLYPLLYNLEAKGLVASRTETPPGGAALSLLPADGQGPDPAGEGSRPIRPAVAGDEPARPSRHGLK